MGALVSKLVGPAISGVTGIIAGKKQANAANKAGEILGAAGDRAAGELTAAGERGIGGILGSGETAATGVTGAGERASAGVLGAGREGIDRIGAAAAGLDKYSDAGGRALTTLEQITGQAPERFGEFKFDPSQLMNDPAVQFRLKQGQNTIENSAAARGLGISGNTLKSLTDYSQGVASDEYGKSFDRARSSYDANLQGFNANRAAGNDRTAALSQILGYGSDADRARIAAAGQQAGLGFDAATGSGGFVTDAAARAGGFQTDAATNAADVGLKAADRSADYRTGGASGRAGGIVGAGNAWANAISGIGKTAAGLDFGGLFGKKPSLSRQTLGGTLGA